MRALLGGLVAGLPEAAVRSIIARAEGIPLYAVETIRMLVADGRLVAREGGGYEPVGELGELAVPSTLHALIAARLDGLEPADRALVQDAAVLGQSFRLDALAAVAGIDAADAGPRLERLVRQDLLRQEVDPRSPERGQFAFVQALIREVAYSTLSLRDRRARHLAAARHFESVGDEELAGALAAHYVAAFRASAAGPEAEGLASQARVSLRAAADRAFALGAPGQAMTFLEQAIEVTPDPAGRAELHERAALAAMTAARNEIALGHFEAAATLYAGVGDRSREARAMAHLGSALRALRRHEEARTLLEAAWARFQDLGDEDPALVFLAQMVAAVVMQVGDYDRALEMSERALAAAERHGLAENAADLLNIKGTTLFYRGRQWEARALLVGARQVAEEAGLSDTALRVMVMLPSFIALDDPRGSLALQQEAIALARRLGRRGIELGILFNATEDARRTGDWDWAVTETNAAAQLDLDQATLLGIRSQLAFYATYRGSFDEVELGDIREAVEALDDRDLYAGIYDLGASHAHAEGRWVEATAAWLKVGDISDLNAPYALPKAGRSAILAGDFGVRPGRPRPAGRAGDQGTGDRCRPGDDPRRARSAGGRPGRRTLRVPDGPRRLSGPRPRMGRGSPGPRGGVDARDERFRGGDLGRWGQGDLPPAAGGPDARPPGGGGAPRERRCGGRGVSRACRGFARDRRRGLTPATGS